ncbi:metal-dependent hydrolase [Pontibacillus salipaludis]|uniref:metal-dependent hydrolase n=1 Tax=Pontibacillus salipaludis TaxID=1697394 RepID=UPI0031E98158
MEQLLHSGIHVLFGIVLTILLFKQKRSTKIIMAGAGVAIFPDIPKFFGETAGHSLLLAPLIGIGMALIVLGYGKSFWYVSLKFTAVVLIGHIAIDYLGNGVQLLAPFSQKEFEFHIIRSLDLPLLALLCLTVLGSFWRKRVATIGFILILVYFTTFSWSKLQLEASLQEKYEGETIEELETFPADHPWQWFTWQILIETKEGYVRGSSTVWGQTIFLL